MELVPLVSCLSTLYLGMTQQEDLGISSLQDPGEIDFYSLQITAQIDLEKHPPHPARWPQVDHSVPRFGKSHFLFLSLTSQAVALIRDKVDLSIFNGNVFKIQTSRTVGDL